MAGCDAQRGVPCVSSPLLPAPMPGGAKLFPFVAVGRVRDGVPLCQCADIASADQLEETVDLFRQLLVKAPSKLSAGQCARLEGVRGSMYCLLDHEAELLCIAVASQLAFPDQPVLQDIVYRLLDDLLAFVKEEPDADIRVCLEGALRKKLGPGMRMLVAACEERIAMASASQTSIEPMEIEGGNVEADMCNSWSCPDLEFREHPPGEDHEDIPLRRESQRRPPWNTQRFAMVAVGVSAALLTGGIMYFLVYPYVACMDAAAATVFTIAPRSPVPWSLPAHSRLLGLHEEGARPPGLSAAAV